jgi:hypothetical protein
MIQYLVSLVKGGGGIYYQHVIAKTPFNQQQVFNRYTFLYSTYLLYT